MAYDFRNLSYLDFEDLARDLIGRELGRRFEAFCAGPDGGIDGRSAVVKRKLILLQAKHYAGSSFSDLKSAMKRARFAIDRLKPKRYILATSCGFTPDSKAELAAIIGPALLSESDIFGPEDLNGLLRKFSDIEQANVKLWLSSAAVLERMVNAASHTVTSISREEIEAKVRVYAPNPSFPEARQKLEAGHVVIISGPPGVGKTTLGEMLSYSYLAEGWEYVAVRGIDDGFEKLRDATRQIFLFDDFLGTAALDARALAAKDSDLARFIKRVRSSKNARFILTTRAPIFEEARRVSERLADKSLDIVKYLLDIGIYTRRIRARILYNHLLVSGISLDHVKSLWSAGAFAKIVDHANYNPRIIEAMTDGVQTQNVSPANYPAEFISALKNPFRIWDVSFRAHIPVKCRHLLYALFFSSDYGVLIDELRTVFDGVHQYMSNKYRVTYDPSDFEEALRILEGGYVDIQDKRVSFINPSLRDYLAHHIVDVGLIYDFVTAAQKADWAERVWDHVTAKKWDASKRAQVARAFLPIAERFHELPEMKRSETHQNAWRYHDLPYSERIALLLTWYASSKEKRFAELALSLATERKHRFDAWRDGRRLVALLLEIKSNSFGVLEDRDAFIEQIEEGLSAVLLVDAFPQDLSNIYDDIEQMKDVIGVKILEAANDAMREQIEHAGSIAEGFDSESDLEEQIKIIHRFAELLQISPDKLRRAVSAVEDRIGNLSGSNSEEEESAKPPSYMAIPLPERDKFSDSDLANLFAPLVHGFK